VNVKRLPRFSPSLSARTTPPCSSTRRRTIASPSPEPRADAPRRDLVERIPDPHHSSCNAHGLDVTHQIALAPRRGPAHRSTDFTPLPRGSRFCCRRGSALLLWITDTVVVRSCWPGRPTTAATWWESPPRFGRGSARSARPPGANVGRSLIRSLSRARCGRSPLVLELPGAQRSVNLPRESRL
jgi:hypothetical protein